MKKKKKLTKNRNYDDMVNRIIRLFSMKMTNVSASQCVNICSATTIEKIFTNLKDKFYVLDKREVEGLIDDTYFLEIFNYVEEIFMMIYSDKENLPECIEFYKNKIVKMHKENDIHYELFIYMSKVCFLLESEGETAIERKVSSLITDALFAFYQSILTYVHKFKNYKMKEFYEKDNRVYLKYDKVKAFPEELISLIYSNLKNDILLTDKQQKLLVTYMEDLNRVYSNFSGRHINPEFYEEMRGHLSLESDYEVPLVDELERYVSIEKILDLPNGRKYAFPNSSVRFEFLNKKKCVELIDMKESKDMICFNVFIRNKGDITIKKVVNDTEFWGDDPSRYKKALKTLPDEKVTTSKLKLPFYIKKKDLGTINALKDIPKIVNVIGYLPIEGNYSEILYKKLVVLVLACLYCAYCDLNLFKDEVKLYNRASDKTLGYNRSSGFRVAHLRKLPVGEKASEDAKRNARKDGFNDIPEGYTYVRETYSIKDNENKKIIKIK